MGRRATEVAGLALTFTAGVVGAGFASGREVYEFFARHGPPGILGAAFAGLLFLAGALLAQAGAVRAGDWSLRGLVAFTLGPWSPAFEGLAVLFLFATLGIVFAGGYELVAGLLPAAPARLVWPIATGVLVAQGPRLLGRLQGALVLLLAAAVLAVAWHHGHGLPPVLPRASPAWVLSSVQYAGYNLLLAVPYFLIAAGRAEASARRPGVVAGALVLALLLVLEALLLSPHRLPLAAEPLPMLVAAEPGGPLLVLVYRLALIGATLAAALGYLAALVERLRPRQVHPLMAALAVALATVPLSAVGLVPLIALVYPIMGVLGAAFFLALAFRLSAR